MTELGIKRLQSQHIAGKRNTNVTDVVNWMGAIQAQDLNSSKWAIGVRIKDSKEEMVDKAINDGLIIRSHLMRPTWHWVSSEDFLPILKLTAPKIRSSLQSRRKQLELDDVFFRKSNAAIERLLEGENHQTREEITSALSGSIPHLDSSRMNHILLEAELNGLICSGKLKNKQHSYALISERLPELTSKRVIEKENTLHLLSSKYFKSHGPATINDFAWWSGLSMSDCRKGVEIAKHELSSIKINNMIYWFSEDQSLIEGINPMYLLPAYDEFIISYKDRTAVLAYENTEKTVSSNGVFRPTIIYDGQVVGLWNKSLKKNMIVPVIHWFAKPSAEIIEQLNGAFGEYASFLSLKLYGID